ncbi:MAG TPA: PQQ-binding-like beta-propeller repeat protein [Actinomycetota bacterium]|jgi:hypothetical protein
MARRTLGLLCVFVTLLLPTPRALAAPGELLWTMSYVGPGDTFDEAQDVVVDPGGARVFITSGTAGEESSDIVTIAYDAVTGDQLWKRRYDGPKHEDDVGWRLAMDPAGNHLFMTGWSEGKAPHQHDVVTIAYDPETGEKSWLKRYDSPDHQDDSAAAIAATNTRVFVTGASGDGIVTVAYNANTGKRLWVVDGAGYGASIAARGSHVYVGGDLNGDFRTLAYAAKTGKKIWSEKYAGPFGGSDSVQSLALSEDGTSVFVTGTSAESSGHSVIATIGYDAASGDELWHVRTTLTPDGGYDQNPSIAVAPDGSRAFVAIQHLDDSSDDFFLIETYDTSDGTESWSRLEDGSGHGGIPVDVTVAPDSSQIYVIGSGSVDFGIGGMITAAYEAATGGPALWGVAAVVDASGYNFGNAVAVAPDGSAVFAAGTTGSDIRIEAYVTT